MSDLGVRAAPASAAPTRGVIDVRSPVDGRLVGQIEDMDAARVRDQVAAARAAQPGWAALGFAGRAAVMGELRRWLVAHREALVETCVAESGRLRDDITFVEVLYPCDALAFWAKSAERYLAPVRVRPHSPFIRGRRVYTRFRPLGVIGVIAPWNFPIGLGFGDAIPALMAGNTAIVKPSEVTPLSSAVIAEGWAAVGGPPGVLQIATGGAATGAALVDAVDMIQFTGSVATGRKVAVQAAGRLIPASLELGGKDPMIVLADADLDRAANLAVRLGFFNSGQACICIERVYVEAPVYDEFVEKVLAKTATVRVGAPGAPGTLEFGAMIHPPQVEIVERHVADAVEKGARVLAGGRRPAGGGSFYEPTVLVDVDHTMDVMRQETFGPVLPIMSVPDAETAVRLANDSPYGLDSSIISRDTDRAERLAAQLTVGTTCINDAVINGFVVEAPFGGSKESGLGGRGGPRGIQKFCDAHTVVITNRLAGKLDDRLGWPNTRAKATLVDRLLPLLFGRR